MEQTQTVADEIKALKKERNALILAHNYVRSEIQDIADFTGDSLELSIKAQNAHVPLIVFCGVRFMGETAKLLSPESKVLLPVPDAGCPMAEMASAEKVSEYRKQHPDTVLVAYVNSTADVKAYVDICCTSGNVEKVLKTLPAGQKILFLPDRNLGGNMNKKMKLSMDLWPGCCPVHDGVTKEMIECAKRLAPEAPVLVHPECRPEVVEIADKALSTAGILKFVCESDAKRFIIGTEIGILHRLRKENPGKTFLPLLPEMVCVNMKKITLESVRDALKYDQYEVLFSPEMMKNAAVPIARMTSLK